MKRMMRWAAAVLCAGLLLTGCGAKDTETTADETTDGLSTQLPDYTWEGVKLADYVTLGAYEGIEYEPTSTEVTEDEVDEVMTQLQQGSATSTKLTEGTVQDGDTINIDFEGVIDGKVDANATAENQTITIGVTSLIPGFVEGLIGKEVGETVVLDLTFPDDYHDEDYASKPVQFTITINYIAGESVVPEITDDWANTLTGGTYTTVEALREYLRETLESEAESSAAQTDQLNVWKQVYEQAKITGLPDGALDYYYALQRREMESLAMSYGTDLDGFIELLGYTEKQMEDELLAAGEDYAGNIMVAYAIVEAIGETVTDDDYQDFVEELALSYGYDDTDQLVEDYGGKQLVMDDLVLSIAIEHVLEKAVAK